MYCTKGGIRKPHDGDKPSIYTTASRARRVFPDSIDLSFRSVQHGGWMCKAQETGQISNDSMIHSLDSFVLINFTGSIYCHLPLFS
jgi:hypothetical protein